MKGQKESKITQGVSFDPEVLRLAKEKADQNFQSVSAYINRLIFLDCGCQLLSTKESLVESLESAELEARGQSTLDERKVG